MSDIVVVSRHRAALEFIADILGGTYNPGITDEKGVLLPCIAVPAGDGGDDLIPIITGNATRSQVEGKIVYGNIPHDLSDCAAEVRTIEFEGTPPRGVEYTLEDMRKAGAKIGRYVVRRIPFGQDRPELFLTKEEAREGGYCC
jgi:hypothetical protein